MCIVQIALNYYPGTALAVCHNRDEFRKRPTTELAKHDNLFYGQDRLRGGTWFATNADGRFALVTNLFTGPASKELESRGDLPLLYFDHTSDEKFLDFLIGNHRSYPPFNIAFGNHSEVTIFNGLKAEHRSLSSGLFCFSTTDPFTDTFKTKRLAQLSASFESNSLFKDDALKTAMYDKEIAPDDQLHLRGLPKEHAKAVSSIFIDTPEYGTRSTTILVKRFSNLSITEHTHGYQHAEISTKRLIF